MTELPRWTIKCPSWDIRKLNVFQVGYWSKQGTEKLEGNVWELEGRILLILGWTLQEFPQVFPYDSRLYSSRISRVFSVVASENSWVGMEQACIVDAAWIPAHHPAPLQPKDPLLLLLHSLSLSPKRFCSLCCKATIRRATMVVGHSLSGHQTLIFQAHHLGLLTFDKFQSVLRVTASVLSIHHLHSVKCGVDWILQVFLCKYKEVF